jgi:hypothetical protein
MRLNLAGFLSINLNSRIIIVTSRQIVLVQQFCRQIKIA